MPNKGEVALRLAQAHYAIEPGITQIFRYLGAHEDDDTDEPIKLLEINENTIPMGIVPIRFGPHPPSGISFPSEIVEITPDEYERLGRELQLPEGWSRGEPIGRPVAIEDARP